MSEAPAPAPVEAPSPEAPPAPAPPQTETAPKEASGSVRGPDGKFAAAAKAEAAKTATQRVKLTVDGAEEEVDLDEAVRRAAKSTAADKRFREAAEERKAAAAERAAAVEENGKLKALFAAMKDDPGKFARDLSTVASQRGVDPVKLAEAILKPLIDAEMEKTLSPEEKQRLQVQRERDEYKRQLDAHAAEVKAAEAKRQHEAHSAEVTKHLDSISSQVMEALKSTTLPQTHETALELLSRLEELTKQGISVTPAQLAKDLEEAEDAKALERQGRTKSTKLVHPDLLKAAMAEANKAAAEELKKQNPMALSRPVVGNGRQSAQNGKPVPRTSASIIRDLMMGHGVGRK